MASKKQKKKEPRITVSDLLDKAKKDGIGSLTPEELQSLQKLRKMQQPAAAAVGGWGGRREGAGRPALEIVPPGGETPQPLAGGMTLEDILDPDKLLPEIAMGLVASFRNGAGVAKIKAAEMLIMLQEKFVPVSAKTIEVDIQVG